jgi:hypothetical protein
MGSMCSYYCGMVIEVIQAGIDLNILRTCDTKTYILNVHYMEKWNTKYKIAKNTFFLWTSFPNMIQYIESYTFWILGYIKLFRSLINNFMTIE